MIQIKYQKFVIQKVILEQKGSRQDKTMSLTVTKGHCHSKSFELPWTYARLTFEPDRKLVVKESFQKSCDVTSWKRMISYSFPIQSLSLDLSLKNCSPSHNSIPNGWAKFDTISYFLI